MSDSVTFDSDSSPYYRHSGAIPVVGVMLALLIGGGTAIVLGAIYGAIDAYNPFPYLTALGTFVVGGVTGAMTSKGVKLGKIRNPFFAKIIGLAVGLIALYVSWTLYIACTFQRMEVGFIVLTNPMHVWTTIRIFAAEAVWSLFSIDVEGWLAWVFWLLEAGIIVGLCWITASELEEPFCEPCDTWTALTEAKEDLSIPSEAAGQARVALELGDYEDLAKIVLLECNVADCHVLQLFDCPNCTESAYVAIAHRTITIDDEGKPDVTINRTVEPIIVPHEVMVDLRDFEAPDPNAVPGMKINKGGLSEGASDFNFDV